jgi:hypothetical protein
MRFGLSTVIAATVLMAGQAWAQQKDVAKAIQKIANESACVKLGQSPEDYIRGMALVYARAVCHPERPETRVASQPPSVPVSTKNSSDALSVYDGLFRDLKIPNKPDAGTMLRHTYVLLTGLGFIESSGWYCVGKYTKQNYNKSTTAEAGLFQTSWGAHKHGASLAALFRSYQKDESSCLLDVFKDDALSHCTRKDAKNWESEHPKDRSGVYWQALTKRCPAFAAEYASVVVRKHGGAHGEFGPIKCYARTQPPDIQRTCRKVQIYPVCDTMFKRIQSWLKDSPAACKWL